MIDRSRGIIFIHIPKTGGSSVESLILDSDEVGEHAKLDDEVLQKEEFKRFFPLGRHVRLRDYENYLDLEGTNISAFRVFTFLRNPQDVTRSVFKFRQKNFAIRKAVLGPLERLNYRIKITNFSVFLTSLLIKEYARRICGKTDPGSYSNYVWSSRNTPVKVFRLEDVSRDSSEFCEFVGLPSATALKKKNATTIEKIPQSILLHHTARLLYADVQPFYQGRD